MGTDSERTWDTLTAMIVSESCTPLASLAVKLEFQQSAAPTALVLLLAEACHLAGAFPRPVYTIQAVYTV